jgi:hypothetical protein
VPEAIMPRGIIAGILIAFAALAGISQVDEEHTVTAWTKSARPGEAITIMGAIQPGDDVQVTGWTTDGGAISTSAVALRLSADSLTVRIPQGMPSASLYRVKIGYGTPILVNAPEVWWIGPDTAGPGADVAIFGRNLALAGARPKVALVGATGAVAAALNIIDIDAFRLLVRLPEALPAGTYTLKVNNGASGPAEWAVGMVQVDPRFAVNWDEPNAPEVRAADFGAVPDDDKDDRAALVDAMAEAARLAGEDGPTGFATVRLDAGVYELSAPLDLGDRIRLLGSGDATRLQPAPVFPAADPSPNRSMLRAPEAGEKCEHGTAAKIERMTLATAGRGPGQAGWAIWAGSACGLHLDHLRVEAKGSVALEAHVANYLRISDSVIIANGSFLGRSRQIFIDGNHFYGTGQGAANLMTFGAFQIAITSNKAWHLDPAPTAATVLTDTFQGRFYVAQTHWAWPREHYIARNMTYNLGVHAELAGHGLDANSGEQVLFEGAGAVVPLDLSAGRLVSVASDALVLRPNGTPLPAPGLFVVTSGTGRGIAVPVQSYDPATGVLRFRKPLPVLPDGTSKAVISQAPYQIAVVGNHFDGRAENVATSIESASAGIQVYPGGYDIAIERNILSDQRGAIAVFAFPVGGTFVGAGNWDIRDNVFRNTRDGIVFQAEAQGAKAFGLDRAVGAITIRGNDLSGALDLPIRRAGNVAVRAIDALSVTDNDNGTREIAGIEATGDTTINIPAVQAVSQGLLLANPVRIKAVEGDPRGMLKVTPSGDLTVRLGKGLRSAVPLVSFQDSAGNVGKSSVPIIAYPPEAMRVDFDFMALTPRMERLIWPGYAGFVWTGTGVYRPAAGDGLGYVATSPRNLAFFVGKGRMMISRDESFTPLSVKLSAANRDRLTVVAHGYSDAAGTVETGRKKVIVNRNRVTLVLFTNPDHGTFIGVRSLVLEPEPDGNNGLLPYFGADDLFYTSVQ